MTVCGVDLTGDGLALSPEFTDLIDLFLPCADALQADGTFW
jgi:hypothetical protein